MTPDLERVARAIFEELFGGGDEYANELIHHPAAKSWDRPTEPRWTQCSEAARAAVAALIEISDDAIGAGEGLTDFILPHPMANTADMRRTEFRCGVQAMLRAVLGDAE